MSSLRIAIIGPGKMGTAIADVARATGVDVAATLGPDAPITSASLAGAQVAIEFTEPAAVIANIRACVDARCPVVVGTTGWHTGLADVSRYVDANDGAMLWSSNFSLGVHALARLVALAGELVRNLRSFDAHLVETHHAAKKDAPSGTALMLAERFERAAGRPLAVSSVRVGSVPGTHSLVVDGPFEQIVVSHEARDRRVFAEGALTAARWLVGRHGVFTLDDVLAPGESS